MRTLLFKESTATALLMLLSLSVIVGMTALVDAAAVKDPTVFVAGSGSVELTWKSGVTRTYSSDEYANLGGLKQVAFIPTNGWHINAVLVDGNPQGILDEDGFTLFNVKAKKSISVTFLVNGGVDDVEAGSGVESFPDPSVWVVFDSVLTAGNAYAYTIGALPPDAKSDSWDIQTDAVFNQSIMIILVLNLNDLGGADPTALRMLTTEYEVWRADVNVDGMVNGADVSIVANANPSEPGDPEYDPALDQDGNDAINDVDVNMVNDHIGEIVWEDVTLQVIVDNDFGLVYIYGLTDHLSIFGIT